MNKDTYISLPTYDFTELTAKIKSARRDHIVIFGNFGALNAGDEAILAGEIGALLKKSRAIITVFSKFPRIVRRIHRVKAKSQYNILALFSSYLRADAVIVGGGGIFCKSVSLAGFLYQLYTIVFFLSLPVLLRKKVFVLGIGFYRNTNPLISFISLSLLKLVREVTVRDQHSYSYLKKHLKNVAFYKDFSFSMELMERQDILTDKILPGYSQKRKNIALFLKRPKSEFDSIRLSQEIVRFLAVSSTDMDFWFYCLDNSGAEGDKSFSNEIAKNAIAHGGFPNSFHFVPATLTPQKLFSTIQLMDASIAMRLHGIIFSYRVGIPFLGIAYDIKCDSFLTSTGKESILPNEVSVEQLFALVKKV